MHTFKESTKVTRVMNAVAAGQATNNGSSVDMKEVESVTFICSVGSIASSGTVTLKAQQSSDDTTFSDLEGTAIAYTDADDNKVAILEITSPRERYVRPVVITATGDGAIDSVVALQASATREPVTQDSTVVGSEQHVAPAEGTA